MKKIYILILASILLCLLPACSHHTEPTQKNTEEEDPVHILSEDELPQQEPPKIELKKVEEEKPLPEKVLIEAPLISQLPELPNGCEVTSLTMLMQVAGVDVDKLTLAKEMKTVPWEENGFHGDPNEGFVGNMYHGAPGYSVYHGPVADLARQYLKDEVVDLTGSDWKAVEKQLAKNHPVWVIVTSAFNRLAPESFQTWHTKNGDLEVTMHEHSVLITGYDQDKVYFNDPLTNTRNKTVNKANFIEGWKQLGSQAISYN